MQEILQYINRLFDKHGFVTGMVIIGCIAAAVIIILIRAISVHHEKYEERQRNRWVQQRENSYSTRRYSSRSGDVIIPEKRPETSQVKQIKRPSRNPNPNVKPEESSDNLVVNGYLQKSNTAPIRPVYSNTGDARQAQKRELESDDVGDEATTPALVMNSAAPSKIKPTELRRPTAIQVGENAETSSISQAYFSKHIGKDEGFAAGLIRPETNGLGTDCRTVLTDPVTGEIPDIAKPASMRVAPTAATPPPGFAPANPEVTKKAPIKRPKSASISRNVRESGDKSDSQEKKD